MMSDNRKWPSSKSINLHWREEKQENQECMDLNEWLFLLVYIYLYLVLSLFYRQPIIHQCSISHMTAFTLRTFRWFRMYRKQKDPIWHIYTMWKSLYGTLSLKKFPHCFRGIYRNGFLSKMVHFGRYYAHSTCCGHVLFRVWTLNTSKMFLNIHSSFSSILNFVQICEKVSYSVPCFVLWLFV